MRLGLLIAKRGRGHVEDRRQVLRTKSARSLRSMLTNTNVALVGMPVLVDMGRCRAMA